MGLEYHDQSLWANKYFSWPECAVRGKNLREEVQEAIGKPQDFSPDGYKIVVRRDRSTDSKYNCDRFYPWNPHYTYEQHWEERKLFLIHEDNKRFHDHINERANRTQQLIAVFASITILVAIIVPLALSCGTTTTEVKGTIPVVIETPVQPTTIPEVP